jgi:translation initiation factor 1
MGKKNKKHREGIVYSTDERFEYDHGEEQEQETLPPPQQDLRVKIDRKGRKGKPVILITGYVGTEEDLRALAKKLKSACGSGGSAKDGEIIIQGHDREQVMQVLQKEGYRAKKSGG